MYVKAGTTHIIYNRSIERVYDELLRVVWVQGKNVTDERGNTVRELKHVFTEITTDKIFAFESLINKWDSLYDSIIRKNNELMFITANDQKGDILNTLAMHRAR